MIKKNLSATLTLILTVIFAAVLAVLCFTAPFIFNWYFVGFRHMKNIAHTVIAAFYICVPFAVIAIYLLIRLLLRIRRSDVFVAENVSALRGLSWCCAAVCVITAVAGFFYFPFFAVCASAVFAALILRVVKNAFSYAVDIKNENELTI